MTVTAASLDLDAVRAQFPALRDGLARFDGPGGSLVPTPVAQAVASAMTSGMCQRDGFSGPGARTEQVVADARAALGRFLGTDPGGVVLGRSMTQLTLDLARTLAATWGPGDEVVVTRLDHDADIRPWVIAAERVGATVRWLDLDPATGELDDVATVLSPRTRLVALTGASNLIGTRPDVPAVAAAAHEVGALVHLDAVHLAAHAPVDRVALGVDLLSVSPYKFAGPHLGALAADPALLETLRPDKLMPSTDAVPERFELGTLPYELLAGVVAAVDFLDGIGGMAAVEAAEDVLLDRLLTGLGELPAVTVHSRAARRTPTVLATVEGHHPRQVAEHLLGHDVVAPAGHFYALEASRRLGLGDDGGLRIGLAPYTSPDEVDRLLTGLAEL